MWIKGNRVYNEVSTLEFRKWDPIEKAYYRPVKKGEKVDDKENLIREITGTNNSLLYLKYADWYGSEEAGNLRNYLTTVETIQEIRDEILEAQRYKEGKRKHKVLMRLREELQELEEELASIDSSPFIECLGTVNDNLVP